MKDGFESLGRVRAQGLALLAIAFAVGVLAGMALERVRAAKLAPQPPAPAGWVGARDGLPPGLNQLALTPDQEQRIRNILEAQRPVTDSLVQQTMPRLAAIHDSVRAEIRAVLTPEQQQRFDEFERRGMRRGRQRMGGMRGGPPAGPMGPPR
jgi:Spy/CpxP family protein refolding chaperone